MAKTKQKTLKLTYFSPRLQRNAKKEFSSLKELKAFVKAKEIKAYGVWKLDTKLSRDGG